jgi:sugar phosphate isomerase/epimerase
MKLAFSTPTSGNDERCLLFTQYRGVGYDGLQLKNAQYSEFVATPERFLETWGDYPGIASGLIAAGRLDEVGMTALRELFGFAGAVGCERIVFCHSLSREGLSDDEIRGFAQTLSEMGKEARQRGVQLSLHHHYNQPVMYRNDFDVLFDAVHDQAIGLTVDTAHLVKSGIDDISGLIQDFSHVIDNFHLKDIAAGEFRVLGQGSIDFEPVFAAIQAIGYRGWLCADEESGTSGLIEPMGACYRFMQASMYAA